MKKGVLTIPTLMFELMFLPMALGITDLLHIMFNALEEAFTEVREWGLVEGP